VERLATFDYVEGVFLPRKFKLIYGIVKWSADGRKTLSLSDQSLEGNYWRRRPGEWGVEVQRGWFWEKKCGV